VGGAPRSGRGGGSVAAGRVVVAVGVGAAGCRDGARLRDEEAPDSRLAGSWCSGVVRRYAARRRELSRGPRALCLHRPAAARGGAAL